MTEEIVLTRCLFFGQTHRSALRWVVCSRTCHIDRMGDISIMFLRSFDYAAILGGHIGHAPTAGGMFAYMSYRPHGRYLYNVFEIF